MNSVAGIICVAIGGAFGASMRYCLTLLLSGLDNRFPWATLSANLGGAFVAGVGVTWLASRGAIGSPLHLLFIVGFLGSFTTLSAYSMETLRLLQAGQLFLAALYILLTILGSLIAAYLGYCLVQAGSPA